MKTKLVGIIPAAGKSSRMGKPKHLLKHRGKPMIYHALDLCVRSRVDYIIIVHNTGVLPSRVGDSYLGVPVRYVQQKERKGIANAVMLCEPDVKYNDMLIVLGDVYYDGDLNEMRHYFSESENVAIFGAQKVENKACIKESYGMTGEKLVEKPQTTSHLKPLLGMGIYFAESTFFDIIKNAEYVEYEQGITHALDWISPAYREPFILEGEYENVNYQKELK